MSLRGRLVLGIAVVSVLSYSSQTFSQGQLEATGGTWNNAPDGPSAPGTVVLYAYRDEAPLTFPLLLRGPEGWNNGAPFRWQLNRERAGTGWSWALLGEIPAVAGPYTLTAVFDGKEVTASFTIRSTSRLLVRPSVRVTSATRERVSVEWTQVRGALSYRVHLVDPRARRTIERSHTTTATSHTFEVSLFPGRYRVNIFAFPIDITGRLGSLPEQFDCSENGVFFDVQ